MTSRSQLPGLVAAEGARPVPVGVLSTVESSDLVSRRLAGGSERLDPAATARIAAHCAGLPLALVIVAARVVNNPTTAPATLAALATGADRLDTFAGGDAFTDLRAVFSWSYRALSPDAARAFRLFGLCPTVDLTAPMLASLAAVPLAAARSSLTELAVAHLMEEHAPGRFTAHDLLRAYAAELVTTVDDRASGLAATARLVDHCLHTAHRATTAIKQVRRPIDLGAMSPGAVVTPLAGTGAAFDWFDAERCPSCWR